MKSLLAVLLGLQLLVSVSSAQDATYSATPVRLKFQRINPAYVNVFFSFFQLSSGAVALRISVNTLLPHSGSTTQRAVTVFPRATLSLRSGRVFLTIDGRSILVAHEGSFGNWKMDEATLKFPKKIDRMRNMVTVSPILTLQ
jgi:hypothetical protein